MTSSEEAHRTRARHTIAAARRGHLPKPQLSLLSTPTSFSSSSSSSITTPSANNDHLFETARENSIEIYDDANFCRNSILTRSARMRKFKFYQYKPIQADTPIKQDQSNPSSISNPTSPNRNGNYSRSSSSQNDNNLFKHPKSKFDMNLDNLSPSNPSSAILVPRDDVLQGKIPLVSEQSKELQELDEELEQLEKKIADLKQKQASNNHVNANIDELLELVNQRNDLLRRQMQLNILEQDKALEKANEELTKELRSLMSIDDSRKTKTQLERQQYLYNQSLALVNKRNALVHHMDFQERGIDDDLALKATLKSVKGRLDSSRDQNCCIQ